MTALFVVLPLRGAAALDFRPRVKLRRKTSVSQLQDAHETAETCDARYLGGEDVYHEFDCAWESFFRKKLSTPCATRPDRVESAHRFGDTVSCPFCPWLQLKSGKGCLYVHLVRHHGPEMRFVCSGTKQPRAVMALHQCDLFRGGRPADYLAQSAELIRCSVGPLSCTRRLRVGRECRVPLTESGPRFVCRDIGSGAVAARRVGNVFYKRGFADVFLRHLMQTGGRMHMPMNRLQCVIQLQGCQLGHTLPEHPKTMWPVAEDIVRSPDVSAWRTAMYDGLRSADGFHVLSVDGTIKIATGVRRRDAGTPLTPGGSQQDHVDHNTCVLTTRTLQCAFLDLAVVPSDSKPHVVVSALENAVLLDDRVGAHWVVVDNASPALHAALSWFVSISSRRRAGHVPSPDGCSRPWPRITVQPGSRMLRQLVCKINVSFPSEVCPDVDALETFRGERNRQFKGDEVFFHNHLCRASLPGST